MPGYRDDDEAHRAMIASLKLRAEQADALAARVRQLEAANLALTTQVEALSAELETSRAASPSGAASPAAPAPPTDAAAPLAFDFGPEVAAAIEGELWSDAVDLLQERLDAAVDLQTRVMAHLAMGDIQADQLGQPDAALESYRLALDLDPTQPLALARLAAPNADHKG